MTIRNQLEPLIRQRGITQTAHDSGIPPSVLSEWLAGKRNRRLGDAQLEALAKTLGITITLKEVS